MTAVIIEDELPLRRLLKNLLSIYCPDVKVVGMAKDIAEGLKEIESTQPQIIFLDIQLTDGSGFELIQKGLQLDDKFCELHRIIFTTAYDQYAMKAFKVNALDYLLKPIDPDELITAVSKAQKLIENEQNMNIGTDMVAAITNLTTGMKKLSVSTQDQLHWLDIDEIVRCESDDNYTRFFMHNGDSILVSKTLKEFENQLNDHDFIRVHRSHLINLNYMKSFYRTEGGYVVMSDGSKIPVSLRKREALLSRLKNN